MSSSCLRTTSTFRVHKITAHLLGTNTSKFLGSRRFPCNRIATNRRSYTMTSNQAAWQVAEKAHPFEIKGATMWKPEVSKSSCQFSLVQSLYERATKCMFYLDTIALPPLSQMRLAKSTASTDCPFSLAETALYMLRFHS